MVFLTREFKLNFSTLSQEKRDEKIIRKIKKMHLIKRERILFNKCCCIDILDNPLSKYFVLGGRVSQREPDVNVQYGVVL